jgi:hypothetical protein
MSSSLKPAATTSLTGGSSANHVRLGGFENDASELLRRDVTPLELDALHVFARVRRDSPVDIGSLGVQLIGLFFTRCDVRCSPSGVKACDAGGNRLNRMLELLHAISPVG